MYTKIPVPGIRGYFNVGDVVIMTSALLLGRKYGAYIGAIGPALADLFLGYAVFVPITFVVKGIEGYPKGLQPEEYDSSTASAFYIHEEQKAINDLNIEVLDFELNQAVQYEYPQDMQKQHERDFDKEQYQISDQLEDWKYL